MAVTWKPLAYQSAVDSAVASEVVARSSADSSLTVLVAGGSVSAATSAAVSEGVIRSTADSSLTVNVSTADSKAVSAASMATSEGVVRSTADSSLTVKPVNQFGAATGNLAMAGNQITDQVLHTVATSAALTGLTAVVGKIAFNSADLSPYVCTASV